MPRVQDLQGAGVRVNCEERAKDRGLSFNGTVPVFEDEVFEDEVIVVRQRFVKVEA
jgi:hypothetical protein